MSSDIKATFGNRLRKLRKERGMTQAVLADHLGIDRSYLAEIETGKRNPCLLTMKVIADGFGITLAKLFARVA